MREDVDSRSQFVVWLVTDTYHLVPPQQRFVVASAAAAAAAVVTIGLGLSFTHVFQH